MINENEATETHEINTAERLQKLIDEVPKPFEVWNELVKSFPTDTVLSDTFGANLKRREVDDISNHVNGYLRLRDIGKDDVVLINLDRGVLPFMAAMGAWKAGAAFCLVESDYAPERIAYLSKDCSAKITISQDNWQEIMATEPCADVADADDHDAAMCIYTSGTTGTPKGILHEYGQIRMEMVSERRPDGTWRESRKTKWALGAPMNFVASLKILVHFIYCGGHLHILGYDTVKNPRKLDSYFILHRINETFLAPMHLRVKKGDLGPLMKHVYTGAAPANNVSLKHGELVNTYTMTESFFTATEFIIDKPYETCPIGTPLFDLGIRLLDENDKKVAPGECGEIAFPNPYCRGYINLPEESARRFRNGLFYTKDIASFEDGVYVMRGRADDMAKINGNRVEPLEIEAVFKKVTGIDCVAKCFCDDEDGFAVLYYLESKANNFDPGAVRASMETQLPYYMVPSYFEPIAEIPVTQLGKVDRKALKKPSLKRRAYVAPETPLENKLCEAVTKVLGLDLVGRDEDLFELGIGSLDVIAVLAEIDMEAASVEYFYRGRTVSDIAKLIEESCGENEGLSEEEMELEGRKHLLLIDDTAADFAYQLEAKPETNHAMSFPSAFRFGRLVNADKLCEAVNTYISSSSTFQAIVAFDDQHRPCYKYAPELFKPVEVEYMTEEDVEQLQQTFLQPHRIFEELPWRIRIIRTKKHCYLFWDIHHIVTDAAGVHIMGEDIVRIYLGQKPRRNNLFARAYRVNALKQSDYYERSRDLLRARMDLVGNLYLPNDPTEDNGIHCQAFETGVLLKDLDRFMKESHVSRSDLICASMVLAYMRYAKRRNVHLIMVVENRVNPEIENNAGCHARCVSCIFCTEDVESLDEYLDVIKASIQSAMETSCCSYPKGYPRLDEVGMVLDDIVDMQSTPPSLAKLAEPIDLVPYTPKDKDEVLQMSFFTLFANAGDSLFCQISTQVRFISDTMRDTIGNWGMEAMRRIIQHDESVLDDYLNW